MANQNPYYPQAIFPYLPQQPQQGFCPPQVTQPPQTQLIPQGQGQALGSAGTNIIWVPDEKSALDYPVAIGNTVILVDYDFKTAFKKSTDLTGKPLPIEIFDLIPRNKEPEETRTNSINVECLITKDEFEIFKTKLKKKLEELSNDDREMVVVKKRGRKPQPVVDVVDVDDEVTSNESASTL